MNLILGRNHQKIFAINPDYHQTITRLLPDYCQNLKVRRAVLGAWYQRLSPLVKFLTIFSQRGVKPTYKRKWSGILQLRKKYQAPSTKQKRKEGSRILRNRKKKEQKKKITPNPTHGAS